MPSKVIAVHSSATYTMSKPARDSTSLVAGLGVENDAHYGVTVQHRSRVEKNPNQPNLRQVHLIHSELFDELRDQGFDVTPGMMGENVTTIDIDLIALPAGARLRIGDEAVVEVTGLRNPCSQLDGLIPGLMKAVLDRDAAGEIVRKTGVMSIVVSGGQVRPGDSVSIELPIGVHQPLLPV
ncbi:MAG TPA: MOSC domain-containing protein [Dehalococcoidia bacterium]|nr:MOSC domain-containing protein [Dehalococcoidia bacterium]HIK89735.1 MOSC domain-containing protein [Dehalococcoidia bacterium]